MYIFLPIAVILLALRVSRGATDTLKKYERRGVMAGRQAAEDQNPLLTNYMRGL